MLYLDILIKRVIVLDINLDHNKINLNSNTSPYNNTTFYIGI